MGSPSAPPPTPPNERREFTLQEGELVRSVGHPREGARVDRARRLIEQHLGGASEARVSVYLVHGCAQSCGFCARSRDPTVALQDRLAVVAETLALDAVGSGSLAALLAALERWPGQATLKITGNDWCAHGRVLSLLDTLLDARRVTVELEGPSTRLADPDLARRVSALPTLMTVILSRHADSDATHDRVVGSPGAGAAVRLAVDHLRGAGAPLRVNTVATVEGLAELVALARWVRARGAAWSLLGWTPDRTGWRLGAPWRPPRLDHLRAALDPLSPADLPEDTRVHAVPPCAVPDVLREATLRPGGAAFSAHSMEGVTFAPACSTCAARSRCCGLPRAYLDRYGDAGVRPLERAPR